MDVKQVSDFEGVRLVTPKRLEDARGHFVETWNRALYANQGINVDFVQDNQSLSRLPYTLRGLHFQSAPYAQAKLIRVLHGSILDIGVDIRLESPTFRRHTRVEIDAQSGRQLYLPVGFAHGFLTLEPNTVVAYKVSAPYSPEHDHGLSWNDPELGLDWDIRPEDITLSDKDRLHPTLAKLPKHDL